MKYEGNMKKYVGNMKISTLPIYGPWELEKFWTHPPISREEGGGSQFPGLGVLQRKDMKHVKMSGGLGKIPSFSLGPGAQKNFELLYYRPL